MKTFAVFAVLAMLSVTAYAGIKPYAPVKPKSVLTELIDVVITLLRPKLAELEIESILLGAHGSLTNVVVHNLENFKIDKMEAPGPLSMKISNATLSIEWASADATYEFIDIEVPEVGVTLNGQGALSGRAEGGRLSVALDCRIEGLTTLQIEDFHDLELSVNSVTDVTLEGIDQADVDAVAGAIPKLIADKYPQLVEENKQAILDKINEILASLT